MIYMMYGVYDEYHKMYVMYDEIESSIARYVTNVCKNVNTQNKCIMCRTFRKYRSIKI